MLIILIKTKISKIKNISIIFIFFQNFGLLLQGTLGFGFIIECILHNIIIPKPNVLCNIHEILSKFI